MLIERYDVTKRMAQALENIARARAVLEEHLRRPEDWHGVIRRQVEAAVVHYSTAIEGNILTRDQVESIIAGEAIEVPEKDRIEAQNYYRAMKWAQTRSLDPDWRMTHETILTLHFMIGTDLGNDYEPLGQYRQAQNTVQDRRTGQAIYWPPRVADTSELMDQFVEWSRRAADRDTSPYIINALAHLNFVAIHPFSDGNGRVGRLLCSLLMMRVGYKAQAFWSLEQYLGEHAVEYGGVLARTLGPRWEPERIDATPWIEWYLEAVASQALTAEFKLRRSIAEFSAVVAGLESAGVLPKDPRSTHRIVIPLWLAIASGSVTRRQIARYTSVSVETLTRDLKRLVDLGLLTADGRGRGARYLPGPQLTAWGDFELLVGAAETDGVAGALRRISELNDGQPKLFDA